MNVMIDPAQVWNVIYNARSNRYQPATSPIIPNFSTCCACHEKWHINFTKCCTCHEKWHMNFSKCCACHEKWHMNFTKCCTCHEKWHMNFTTCCACHEKWHMNFTKCCTYHTNAKWISWLIRIAYATSFTMRGATGITLQPHQVLRLPRKMNLMIDPHHIWNVIYNAWSNRHHPPTSPSTAPATQNESHDWSASHMKRHLQCVEQQASPSNRTKYCACHAKWMSWLIVLTYETSFPMRRAARVTLPLHQVLRLPHNMNVMIDPAQVWNVIYNARSNRYQPATSPNTAPATQNCIP